MTDAFDAPTRIAIDALHAHVAVLDGTGRILAVNDRWRRFGRLNGASSDYVGENYADICEQAVVAGDGRSAARVLKGLRRLLSGEAEQFAMAYPCGERSFRLREPAGRTGTKDHRLARGYHRPGAGPSRPRRGDAIPGEGLAGAHQSVGGHL